LERLNPAQKKKVANGLQEALIQKIRAISNALGQMPRGELLIALRKTTWANLEKDLTKRIATRKKYLKKRAK
jgi:hypothetical protein